VCVVCVCVCCHQPFCSIKHFPSLLVAQQPYWGLGLLNVEVSRGLRLTALVRTPLDRDRILAETSI
jgi:hypothetical protein